MLARPEPGTREHMLLWLASQPADRTYDWHSPRFCACGTYAREAMGKSDFWWSTQSFNAIGSGFARLNTLALYQPHTYGALYARALKAWG